MSTIKINGAIVPEGPVDLGALVVRGANLKAHMIELKEELDEVNERIVALVSPFLDTVGVAHVYADAIDCTVTKKDKVVISDAATLRSVLGKRWEDLVRIKMDYAAEAKLVELAMNADDVLGSKVANCLEVSPMNPAVTYKAVVQKKMGKAA